MTVEWYERGETKGKEVEIDAILALNPELAVGPRHHTPHLQPMPNKLARVSLNTPPQFICAPSNTGYIRLVENVRQA